METNATRMAETDVDQWADRAAQLTGFMENNGARFIGVGPFRRLDWASLSESDRERRMVLCWDALRSCCLSASDQGVAIGRSRDAIHVFRQLQQAQLCRGHLGGFWPGGTAGDIARDIQSWLEARISRHPVEG